MDIIDTIQKEFISPLKNKNILYHLKYDIRNKYGFNIINMNPLEGGHAHLTYLARTICNKKLVLRVYRNRTEDYVQSEADLLNTLSKHNELKNHISIMIADSNGCQIGKIKNHLYCIFHYIDNCPVETINEQLLQPVLSITRSIHEIGAGLSDRYPIRRLQNSNEISPVLFHACSNNQITKNMYQNMLNIIEQYNSVLNNYKIHTILHCDIHDSNLLINNVNNMLVLIDFDDFCVGPYIIDLVVIVREWCIHENYFDVSLANKMLEAYRAASSKPFYFQAKDFVTLILCDLVRLFSTTLKKAKIQNKEIINLICNGIEIFETDELRSLHNKIKLIQTHFKDIVKNFSSFSTPETTQL